MRASGYPDGFLLLLLLLSDFKLDTHNTNYYPLVGISKIHRSEKKQLVLSDVINHIRENIDDKYSVLTRFCSSMRNLRTHSLGFLSNLTLILGVLL